MPFNIGPGELILILVIALVVLGPGKLPDAASSLGKSVREFRKAATDVTEAGRLDAASTNSSSSTAAATSEAPSTGAGLPPVAAPEPPAPEAIPATAGKAADAAPDSNAS